MDNRTFKVAGTSTDPKGSSKVRFANDYVGRIKTLNMRRHTEVKLVELEKPMSKADICSFLMKHSDFQSEISQTAITQYVKRNVGKVKLEVDIEPATVSASAPIPSEVKAD